jgi:putative flippase GtrA
LTAHAKPGAPSRFWQWIRHHATAIAATAVDYSGMVAAVEFLHVRPVPATAMGAFAGALTNFTLNRTFTYKAQTGAVQEQMWRYALVSAASLALNTAGVWLFHNRLGLQYLAARLIASVIVSNGWNYPMQRFFVFSRGATKDAGNKKDV